MYVWGVYSSIHVILCIQGVVCAIFSQKTHHHHCEVVAATVLPPLATISGGYVFMCVIGLMLGVLLSLFGLES